MIHLGYYEDSERLYVLGLTDVNLSRLQEGRPIKLPVNEHLQTADSFVLFHATREACIELARGLGIEEHRLLDLLGEG